MERGWRNGDGGGGTMKGMMDEWMVRVGDKELKRRKKKKKKREKGEGRRKSKETECS
jgi:hypothetical protein